MSGNLARTESSRKKLENPGREVPARHSVTNEHQLYLFRLLRPCIQWTDDSTPRPKLIKDPVAQVLFNVLWKLNTGLVYKGAKQFGPRAFSPDAAQDAHIGLRRGLLSFDPDRGFLPSTYLMWWIRQGVTRQLANSHFGAIPLQADARREIREGKVERPLVFSYHGFAHQHGFGESEQLGFMTDARTPSVETQVESRQLFFVWRDKLAHAAAIVERESQVNYLLFALSTGYGRYPKRPVRLKVLKRLTRIKGDKIQRRVEKVVKRIGRLCGLPHSSNARQFIDAMVEFSLFYGIPL